MDGELSTRERRWLTTVACLAVGAVVGTMSALYTSLGDIAAETGATQAQLTWIVDSYTLVLAALVLAFGAVGDRIGRRLALVVGLGVFAVASVVPLLAAGPEWIIASRALAGVGAALVMPSTLSVLTASFPAGERGRAVGVWAGVAGAGAVIGLLVSGVVVQYWSWRAMFAMFVATGVVLMLASMTLPESRSVARERFDVPGAVLSAVWVGALVFALIEGPHRGWSDAAVVVGFAVAAVTAIGFVAVELRTARPLLDVRYFRRPGFAAGSLGVLLQFLVSFGVFLLLVQYLQMVRGYDPFGSALALAPMAVPLLLLSLVAPVLSARVGLRVVTVAGMLVMAGGLFWFSRLTVDTEYLAILYPMLVVSAGMGLSAAPATFAIVADSPADEHGVAAAVNDATREIGAAIGIAIAGSTVAGRYSEGVRPSLAQMPEAARGAVESSMAAALEIADRLGPIGQPVVEVARRSYTDGVGYSLFLLAMVALGGALLATAIAPGRGYRPRGDAVTG